VFYVDSSGSCVSGEVFCVGSGSTLAYSYLDSAGISDLPSVESAMEVAIGAVRLATVREGHSGVHKLAH
jgi:20S proteasome subunit beta 5